MAVYYNENNPQAAAMLRQLIIDGLIADGDVDERSIVEVQADELRGYNQHHFFAGIGGWSVALRIAGWDDARSVWTGSCPCQPFSSAGKQKGHSDERHLWPHWARLIREYRPPVIFGEQVAGAIAFGWWDDVASDLEAENYACAAAVLPACSVGKAHKRDRLWFVADSLLHDDSATNGGGRGGAESISGIHRPQYGSAWESSGASGGDVAYTSGFGQSGQGTLGKSVHPTAGSYGKTGDAFDVGAGVEWINCPDGKTRPIESSICLLADGLLERAPILHALGNAIVPEVAAQFIMGWEDVRYGSRGK